MIQIAKPRMIAPKKKSNKLASESPAPDHSKNLLLELIRRDISKVYHCFGHFVTLIRVCLTQYNRLEYLVSEIQITVQKAKKRYKSPATDQKALEFR